ncbi:MAG: sucrase ferredoxin [Anaerolineales bacterium]|nr:sucrase ferredoxin [Anaerolineales bacterium]
MTVIANGATATAAKSLTSQSRFCAVVSRENDEDPIGTAPDFDHLLALELAPPWPEEVWQAGHTPDSLTDLFQQARTQGLRLATQAILPSLTYHSRPGWTRLFSLRRPVGPFAVYLKEEFIVPNRAVTALVEALLLNPAALAEFTPFRQPTTHLRELLVCTHGSRDACCGKFGFPAFQALQRYAAHTPNLFRVWRTSHFGGHRFAPTVLDLPEGRCWGHLELEALEDLALRRGQVSQLRSFYRGWSGLTRYEQVAERELFMRQGWDWVNYLKEVRTLELDEGQNRAEIWLRYTTPDGRIGGAYQATVDFSHWVSTLDQTGDRQLTPVKQYRVSRLVKAFETPESAKSINGSNKKYSVDPNLPAVAAPTQARETAPLQKLDL